MYCMYVKIFISQPRIISKILFRGIMIPTYIKTVTLTYSLIDILISLSINATSKTIFPPTLRTTISCTSTTISLQLISIFTIHS